MAQQSSNGNRPKLSEKGLLTPDNCVVALIDHQAQMLLGEQFGVWIQTKKLNVSRAASVCLVGGHHDRQHPSEVQ